MNKHRIGKIYSVKVGKKLYEPFLVVTMKGDKEGARESVLTIDEMGAVREASHYVKYENTIPVERIEPIAQRNLIRAIWRSVP